MHKLRRAFPSIDLRFQLTSGPMRGPVMDVDLGLHFPHRDDSQEEGVLLMPEILLPVCSPGYAEQARSQAQEGDTLMNLSDGDRDWHHRFSSFQRNGRRVARTVDFSDYAIVIQAALLGQGIALGWLNSTAYWLCTGALVPGEQEAETSRRVSAAAAPRQAHTFRCCGSSPMDRGGNGVGCGCRRQDVPGAATREIGGLRLSGASRGKRSRTALQPEPKRQPGGSAHHHSRRPEDARRSDQGAGSAGHQGMPTLDALITITRMATASP